MGKKKKDELDKQFAGFSAGMTASAATPPHAIKTLWDILLPFSDYAFNKAHSAAYGLVSYWTAYLKANYPAEYMAALLTSVKDDKDKSAIYLNECRRMKIQVLPPDVNESAADFTPVGNDIRFGLTAIRNVGSNVVDGIVAGREEKGRYADFNDFMDKVPALVCNKRVIESLIKAGAFDEMKHRRRALVAIHETAVDQYVDIKRNEAIGQDSLFGGLDDDAGGFGISVAVPDIDEWDKMTLLGHEREMLGLYVSDHPLLGLEHVLANGLRLHHRPADARRGPRRTARRSRSAAWSPRCSARSPSAATPGRWSPSRTSTAPSTCCCSRAPTSWPARCSSRTRSSRSRAGSRAARTSPSCTGRRSASRTSPTGRPARW